MGAPRTVMAIVLREKLDNVKAAFKVVVMPDFYLDYLLKYPGSLNDMTASLEAVARRGGGNLLGWNHVVGRGGNSSNIASQLSKLGVKVVPIIETDALGRAILEASLTGTDLSHVKTTGIMSSSLCLEVSYLGRRVNIMMSSPGSHAGFGPEKLTTDDKELIRQADFVVVLNWGQNEKGTYLAEEVFKIARKGGAITFFDPGDLTSRAREIEDLKQQVFNRGLIDVLSVNETELLQLSSVQVNGAISEKEPSLFAAARDLGKFGTRVDLHSPEFSATFQEGRFVKVPCLKIETEKVTGAGDIWNAVSIFGQGVGLEDSERLLLANAAAAAYLKRAGLEPPDLEEILNIAERLEKITENQRR
jgi:sugar/nucleoside kinase (ribokinase family)